MHNKYVNADANNTHRNKSEYASNTKNKAD